MLFSYTQLPLNEKTWRRINMRKVSHLIAAEMLHNLYNRHWPRINSLRFRHTITNFKHGIVEAHAPVREWSYLQHWLSERFLALDPILIREIEAIMNPTYEFVDEVMQRVDSADLKNISNRELALLLIDIMDFPLGEIYKLNVVQIEYGLNFALHRMLEKYEPNEFDRNELLAQIIAPGELTVAQKEEVAFGKVLALGRKKNSSSPATDDEVLQHIKEHQSMYASTHCAYGEEPPIIDDYINKYVFMYTQNKPPLTQEDADANVRSQHEKSEKILLKLGDNDLVILCNLMAKIGVFRDNNKAKLGETVARRLRILDEIARRTHVSREEINYYLMSELAELLDKSEKLPEEVINERKTNGVCFTRNEDVTIGIKTITTSDRHDDLETFRGICASSGQVIAKARIILSKDDIAKVNPGDIMVAVGTDFDLLEIMNLSGGIITEEGGLLSHASVVSRELRKPCLIGVTQATKLLNDGDNVELNATEGRITIIERGQP